MKPIGSKLVSFSLDRPRTVVGAMVALTLAITAAALVPTLWPASAAFLHPVTIDTDPENMLAKDELVRVFHTENKQQFSLHDAVVLGVVNEKHADGVFNPDTLSKVYAITELAKTLEGVIEVDVMSLSTMDSVESGGPGVVKFDWLMPRPPESLAEAHAVRDRAMRVPFLRDTLVSGDGRAVVIYVPLMDKSVAHDVSVALEEIISKLPSSDDQFHIAGLPVAEDTFGIEMFIQMAISAPIAMVVIFGLMWFFFRRIVVVISPMILAMVAAMTTMGLLVISGNTIHIMSSMIPIFIMPIAVLDAVHIISDFFERYQDTGDRRKTMESVMRHLFRPMLYTSLTTAVGFASLALTPIPPVQVFGVFVALGVLVAWFWTITFVPAFVMLISESRLQGFGRVRGEQREGAANRGLLAWMSRLTFRHARPILVGMLAIVAVAALGISRIHVNDNPTRWFEPDHKIRIADRVLNSHFGGTYDAYLTLRYEAPAYTAAGYGERLHTLAAEEAQAARAVFEKLGVLIDAQTAGDAEAVLDALDHQVRSRKAAAETRSERVAWELAADFLDEQFDTPEQTEDLRVAVAARAIAIAEALDTLDAQIEVVTRSGPGSTAEFLAAIGDVGSAEAFVARAEQIDEIFKSPEVLAYMERLQQELGRHSVVGKSNSLADIVKVIHRDLLSGEKADYRLPDRREIVAETLAQYQSSHRKDDLWHFVTPNYQAAVVWVQLKSGDNKDMESVVLTVDRFFEANPPPVALSAPTWFGLTYLNVVWQQKMVSGMLRALLGSFVVVLIMMILLFRSLPWGLLSMVPLSVTVGLIYGILGLIGKEYDMPVAVLSSLALGLAIDYAIHFLTRARQLSEPDGDWPRALTLVFREPAVAISRNVVVVGVGFLPLLLAPLVPYQTVGILIASILLAAGAATLVILPALITLFQRWLFR